jgi:hypothetical protein
MYFNFMKTEIFALKCSRNYISSKQVLLYFINVQLHVTEFFTHTFLIFIFEMLSYYL